MVSYGVRMCGVASCLGIVYILSVAGMFDLEAPANATELHLLCQLLDAEEGEEMIEYMALGDGLAYIRWVN